LLWNKKYSIDTLPIPNDERIRIREVAERIVAVRRYSGRWTDANYQRNLQLLNEALSNVSLEAVGEPLTAPTKIAASAGETKPHNRVIASGTQLHRMREADRRRHAGRCKNFSALVCAAGRNRYADNRM
jgi:hypothetical protein